MYFEKILAICIGLNVLNKSVYSNALLSIKDNGKIGRW